MLSYEIKELMNDEIMIKIIYDEYSYISGLIYLNDNELYINYFHVKLINRGKGIGSKLLKEIISYSKKIYNINLVRLDDISSNYRKSHNIYEKFGFVYLNKYDNSMNLKIK